MQTQRVEQSPRVTGASLDIWVIHAARLRRCFDVIGHPFEDERVKPIAGPAIIATQRFEDDQRTAEFPGELDRSLEPEIESYPPRRNHPIDDELSPRVGCEIVERVNARCWHC